MISPTSFKWDWVKSVSTVQYHFLAVSLVQITQFALHAQTWLTFWQQIASAISAIRVFLTVWNAASTLQYPFTAVLSVRLATLFKTLRVVSHALSSLTVNSALTRLTVKHVSVTLMDLMVLFVLYATVFSLAVRNAQTLSALHVSLNSFFHSLVFLAIVILVLSSQDFVLK